MIIFTENFRRFLKKQTKKGNYIVPHPAYIVGIDLGTTNCVVAYTETDFEKCKKPKIRVLEILQLVSAGVVEKRRILPSFILIPGKHDVSEEAMALPWDEKIGLPWVNLPGNAARKYRTV